MTIIQNILKELFLKRPKQDSVPSICDLIAESSIKAQFRLKITFSLEQWEDSDAKACINSSFSNANCSKKKASALVRSKQLSASTTSDA